MERFIASSGFLLPLTIFSETKPKAPNASAMLSIIIPTYNYNCAHLVCELQKQCEEVQAMFEAFDYEIIVGDDNSTDAGSVAKNAVIEALPNCKFLLYNNNAGRTGHRNRLLHECHGEWVVIIDADAEVVTADFILNYWTAAQNLRNADIIVGGLETPATAPPGCELRHRYELEAEKRRTLEYRRAHPADNFTAFNVMVNRRVLETMSFNPQCTEYGYEDALFGIEAEQRGYAILHIDNPLLHTGINPSEEFLRNSEAALRTLHKLGKPMTERARVAIMAAKLQRAGMAKAVKWLFRIAAPALRHQLLSAKPSLKAFAFYKLGYYLNLD